MKYRQPILFALHATYASFMLSLLLVAALSFNRMRWVLWENTLKAWELSAMRGQMQIHEEFISPARGSFVGGFKAGSGGLTRSFEEYDGPSPDNYPIRWRYAGFSHRLSVSETYSDWWGSYWEFPMWSVAVVATLLWYLLFKWLRRSAIKPAFQVVVRQPAV